MVNTYHKQKGHKFLTNLTNSEYLAFLYSDHTKKSTDTDEASNTAETKTKECKIELSDNGILVDGETISENTEDSVYAGAAEHTVITITIDYGNSDRVCSWGRSCTGDFNWIYKAANQAAFN